MTEPVEPRKAIRRDLALSLAPVSAPVIAMLAHSWGPLRSLPRVGRPKAGTRCSVQFGTFRFGRNTGLISCASSNHVAHSDLGPLADTSILSIGLLIKRALTALILRHKRSHSGPIK